MLVWFGRASGDRSFPSLTDVLNRSTGTTLLHTACASQCPRALQWLLSRVKAPVEWVCTADTLTKWVYGSSAVLCAAL